MFRKFFTSSGRNVFRHAFIRDSSTSSVQWDLVTGVCVERPPLVTAPLSELEAKYKQMLDELEIEKSLKSDHELRRESDKKQAELSKNELLDATSDAASIITAQDFEDACNEEFASFKLASIETEADRKNDTCSLNRSLQRHLVLVTRHQLGDDVKTLLPQGVRSEGETLRQTAERVLAEHCGSTLKVQFLGNAPCGFYKYKYPNEINGKVGAKVFFYYAKYKEGNVEENKTKFEWVTRQEMATMLPERYHNCVTDFLVSERY